MVEISLQNVSRRFDDASRTRALSAVDLEIAPGDFVAITGPSGSGKSTLLNLIGLLDQPSTGSISVGGMNVTHAVDKHLTRLRAGTFAFIFQSFHLLDRRYVVDSVELGLVYQGVSSTERRARSALALKRVGLLDKAWHDVSTLSGGERQRVAIARAVASGVGVVIADEPTGNLDSENARLIVGLLCELNQGGTTVVLVTHSAEVADEAARRVSILDGRIVSDVRLRPPSTHERATASVTRGFRVRLRDVMRDSYRSLLSRGTRTTALVAAVAIAVGLATATFGITGSAAAQVTDTFNAHANRDVTAQWSESSAGAASDDEKSTLTQRLVGLNGVVAAALVNDLSSGTVASTSARPTLSVPVFSGSDSVATAARLTLQRAPGAGTVLGPDQIYIGQTLARQMQLAPVDTRPVLFVNGLPKTVVGVIVQSPRLPTALGGVLQKMDPITGSHSIAMRYAMVLTKAGAAQQVSKQVALVINPYSPTTIRVEAPRDPSTLRDELQSDVRNTLIAFTGIALLAAVVSLANSMMLSIMERRSEIGLRRAIGARKRQITALILAESTFLGAAGGLVGCAIGIVGVLAVTLVRHWIPIFDVRLVPVAIVGGILVGMLGGLAAAARASRVAPSQALRL